MPMPDFDQKRADIFTKHFLPGLDAQSIGAYDKANTYTTVTGTIPGTNATGISILFKVTGVPPPSISTTPSTTPAQPKKDTTVHKSMF
jgi:hypothetical protein